MDEIKKLLARALEIYGSPENVVRGIKDMPTEVMDRNIHKKATGNAKGGVSSSKSLAASCCAVTGPQMKKIQEGEEFTLNANKQEQLIKELKMLLEYNNK